MPSRKKSYPSPNASRGVGLIEVMVAVLILGVGLLGIAAMQATALRNSQSALERSQAVILSYTILDAMRANPTAARAPANSYNMVETCATPTASTTLVDNDKRAWIAALQTMGAGTCGTATCANNVCTVIVKWNDSRGTSLGDDDDARTVTTTTRI